MFMWLGCVMLLGIMELMDILVTFTVSIGTKRGGVSHIKAPDIKVIISCPGSSWQTQNY